MKRKYLLLLLVMFVVPFITVKAAVAPKVLTLDAKESGKTISYSGTIEDGAHAVMCKLLDSSSNEVDLLSTDVEDNKFEGNFTVEVNDQYTVSCANYEGGETKTATLKFSGGINSKNVKTGDNIIYFVITAIVSLVGVVALSIVKKKRA